MLIRKKAPPRIHDIVRCPECLRLVPLSDGRYLFAHTNVSTRHLCRLSGSRPFDELDPAPDPEPKQPEPTPPQPPNPIGDILFGDTATVVEIPKPKPKKPKKPKHAAGRHRLVRQNYFILPPFESNELI